MLLSASKKFLTDDAKKPYSGYKQFFTEFAPIMQEYKQNFNDQFAVKVVRKKVDKSVQAEVQTEVQIKVQPEEQTEMKTEATADVKKEVKIVKKRSRKKAVKNPLQALPNDDPPLAIPPDSTTPDVPRRYNLRPRKTMRPRF